jgi:hypothetical protein
VTFAQFLAVHDNDLLGDVIVAVITAVTTITVVTIPLWFQHRRTAALVQKSYDTLNSVHEDEVVPDGDGAKRTLGQTVRDLDRQVTAGFVENTAQHDQISEHVTAVQDTVHANTRRIDRLELDSQ